jgi:beta-alanine degradation protein BauB
MRINGAVPNKAVSIKAVPIIAMAMLFGSCAAANSPAVNSGQTLPTALQAGWKGEPICELLYENADVRTARCTFPPGGGHDKHYHPPHWGYIIQGGTMRITTAAGTTERVLKSGTSWWSDGIAWHEPINVGTETAVYIIVEPK